MARRMAKVTMEFTEEEVGLLRDCYGCLFECGWDKDQTPEPEVLTLGAKLGFVLHTADDGSSWMEYPEQEPLFDMDGTYYHPPQE